MTTRIQLANPRHPAYSPLMRRRWILVVPVAVLVTALLAGVVTWTRSGSMERDLTARAQAHFDLFGLQKFYAYQANRQVAGIRHFLEELLASQGMAGVRKHLGRVY